MSNYRKLIAAIVGVLLMLVNDRFGLDLTGMKPEITNAVIGLLTAVGVWAVPNTPGKPSTTLRCAPLAVCAVLLLFLAACAGSAETRATNALAIACDSYATTLGELADHREAGRLTETQIARVDSANALTEPICTADSVVDPASAVGTVRGALTILKGIPR